MDQKWGEEKKRNYVQYEKRGSRVKKKEDTKGEKRTVKIN